MAKPDPFAAALEEYARTGRALLEFTREDGRRGREDAWWYFTRFRDFPRFEKRILQYARGRVLDVGCGAGRHSLYLGRRGLAVVGLEKSARVAAIARKRGMRDVCVASACGPLAFEGDKFDAVLLLGNNLGFCGDRASTLLLLRELHRITRPAACLLCSSRAPDLADARDLAYWNMRVAEGAALGEMELSLLFKGEHARVRLFLVSPFELMKLARGSGWELERLEVETRPEEGYAALLKRI